MRLSVATRRDAPPLRVRLEGALERLGKRLGRREDIHTGDRAFDARFFLESSEPLAGRRALRADVRHAVDEAFSRHGVDRLTLRPGTLGVEADLKACPPEQWRQVLVMLDRAATMVETRPMAVRVLEGQREGVCGPDGLLRCAYCRDGLTGEEADLVACERCRTALHGACWEEHGGCPMLGCDGEQAERARARLTRGRCLVPAGVQRYGGPPMNDAPVDTAAPAPRAPISRPLLAAALAAWGLLTFGHGVGLELAGRFFAWAREPGALSEEGGQAGMRVAEGGLALVFGALALLVVARVVFALRGARRDEVVEALVPWVAWAALLFAVWKIYIVYATELVHFAQYALVGYLVARALDGGRRPAVAFLLTVGLAALDEVWQHYGLAFGDAYHWMDWSDLVLDALGATAGILPLVTLTRLEHTRPLLGDARPPDTTATTRRVVLGAAVLTLPLLLLSPVTTSRVLGHYRHYPYWGEYTNDKPTHWPGPREGVPLALGMVLVLATLLEPRRGGLSQRAIMGLALLWAISIDPPSRAEGMPVHEVVPATVARRASAPIVVDGRLDEADWARAERVGPFLLNGTGAPSPSGQETFARVLWDAERVYFAFEVHDRDVWARDTHRDDVYLPSDEVVEVFLDDGGDEVTYYELEVSPKNVVYDLFCYWAAAPVDYNPDMPATGLPQWDAKAIPSLGGQALETAVTVQGTLDVVASGRTPVGALDEDQGYTVELALPWSALWVTSRPTDPHRPVPPRAGDRWRLGLYRIERPRPAALEPGAPVAVDRAGALTRLGVTPARLDELLAAGALAPDADGRFPTAALAVAAAQERAEFQAWSPTYDPGGSFHRPQFFGVLEFGE